MARRFDSLVFPNGKSKAFTLSYDDGVVQDRRLVALFNQYNVKGTFNLNSGILGEKVVLDGGFDISKVDKEEIKELYKGHEVAGHSLYHSLLNNLKEPALEYEIIEDKRLLENYNSSILKMFAYPFGLYDEKVISALKQAGYKGARTTKSTNDFNLPNDFLEWNPTCHHDDEKVFELLEKFINAKAPAPQLFYLWGHAYEFDGKKNWDHIEKILKYIDDNRKDIWFATNGEIIDYVNAYKNLEYSVDGKLIYNPSLLDVEIMIDFGKTILLKSGKITIVE